MESLVMNMAGPDPSFWHGKRILLTGHTGFKGSWLTIWLNRLGASVTGLSLAPDASPNLFALAGVEALCQSNVRDIRDASATADLVRAARPQIVFHLAAQSLVRPSYSDPLQTFATNVMGTAHVLDALRDLECARVAVMVTTDKVYRNNEWHWPYREEDALGGHDPYSASKAASEIVIASYRDSFLSAQGVAVGSARAGNVIGGGDWSVDRLIPDAIRAWQTGTTLEIRNPQATRPWQHVLEPIAGYLMLAERLWQQPDLAGAYNFGPHTSEAATVREIIQIARQTYTQGQVNYGTVSDGLHEAGHLALEIAKSRTHLGVSPQWGVEESVRRTMRWYRSHLDGASARELCNHDIDAYVATLAGMGAQST